MTDEGYFEKGVWIEGSRNSVKPLYVDEHGRKIYEEKSLPKKPGEYDKKTCRFNPEVSCGYPVGHCSFSCRSLPHPVVPMKPDDYTDHLSGDWKDVPDWAILRLNWLEEKAIWDERQHCPLEDKTCPDCPDYTCSTVKHCYPAHCEGSCGHNEVYVFDQEKPLLKLLRDHQVSFSKLQMEHLLSILNHLLPEMYVIMENVKRKIPNNHMMYISEDQLDELIGFQIFAKPELTREIRRQILF